MLVKLGTDTYVNTDEISSITLNSRNNATEVTLKTGMTILIPCSPERAYELIRNSRII